MKAKYSILSVLIRPEIQEKISIGLLLFNDNEVYFGFSRNKLQVSKELLSSSSHEILKSILDGIEKKIEPEGFKPDKKKFKLYKNSTIDNTFSESYISYLSNYSNNTISFTNPKEINLAINSQNFLTLFEKYIDRIISIPDILQKVKPAEYIKQQFGEKINLYYDFNTEVTHEQVHNLITPVRINFVGRNEIDVYAHTIDMEMGHTTVANHINAFIQLKTTYARNKVEMKDFLITKEPAKDLFPRQHDMWNQLRSSKILNHLDLSESEAIITYAQQHAVVPLTQSVQ